MIIQRNAMKFLSVVILVLYISWPVAATNSTNETTTRPATKTYKPTTKVETTLVTTAVPTKASTKAPTDSPTKAPTKDPTKVPTEAPTTEPADVCSRHDNTSCGACTKEGKKCVWCGPTKKCLNYDTSKIIPRGCPHNKWYLGQCFLSGFVLIIAVPVIGIFIIVTCLCCCYCKCCRNKQSWKKIEDRIAERARDRQARNAERKAERQKRADQVRMKYGLLKNDNDDDDEEDDGDMI